MATAAERHQGRQEALIRLLLNALAKAFGLVDVTDKKSMSQLAEVVAALVQRFSGTSSAISTTYYTQERQAHSVQGVYRPQVVAAPDVRREVEQAFSGRTLTNPDELTRAVSEVETIAGDAVSDVSVETLFQAIHDDPEAKGWARIPEADACYFCAMLASRGAVYSKDSFVASNGKFTGKGKFKVHDNCRCNVEPAFGEYEMTAQARAAKKLWTAVSDDGFHGPAAVKEFRRRYEKRADGPTFEGTPRGNKKVSPDEPVRASEITPDRAEAVLTALEKSLDIQRRKNKNGKLDDSIKKTEERIAALRAA